MSKLINVFTAAALIVSLGSAAIADEDDLFSDVPTKSVFEDSAAKRGADSPVDRITKPAQLRDLLKAVGFEAKVASSRAVTLKKALDPWTFPVLVLISEDEKQVGVMLGLSSIKDIAKELPADKLLKMMTASQENAPVLFSYHAKRERTEVSKMLKNEDLTGQILRDAINDMAVLAKKTSAVWGTKELQSAATGEATPPVASTPTSPQPSTPAPTETPATKIVGKWSAAKSTTEAFAVELTSSGTFKLVYINNGKQTKSSGKFTATGGSLSLIGSDGLKLKGKLTVKSETQFSFTPANGKALEFTKAK